MREINKIPLGKVELWRAANHCSHFAFWLSHPESNFCLFDSNLTAPPFEKMF